MARYCFGTQKSASSREQATNHLKLYSRTHLLFLRGKGNKKMGVRCYESGVFWIHMAWCCVACVSGRCGVVTIRAAVESGDGLRKLMFYMRKVIAGCGICLRDFVISLAIGPNKCDE